MKPGHRERALLLAQRRESLLAQSQTQREVMGRAWSGLERPARWIDAGFRAAGLVRERPWMVALPALALAVLRPRWIGRTAVTVFSLARLWSASRR